MSNRLILNTSLISILLIPVVYLFFVFIGESIGWSTYSYDSWRVEQLILMGISFVIYTLVIHLSPSKLALMHKILPNTGLWIKQVSIVICLVLIAASVYAATSSMLALMDLYLTFGVFLYLYIFYQCLLMIQYTEPKIISNNRKFLSIQPSKQWIDNSMAVIALLPLYISFWCVFGHYLYITADIPLAWHGAFINIRHYDDTLLPCLFLLWHRPGFLKRKPLLVFFCASFYLLTLWIDAARAAWLSIFFGLLFCLCYGNRFYKNLLLPALSILASLAMYACVLALLPKTAEYTVMRSTSSGRLDMWMASIDLWLQNFFLGIGGANFVFYEKVNHLSLGNVHNVVLQFLMEWGLVGLVFLMGVMYYYIKCILLAKNKIPTLLFAGAVAQIVNMLFSASYVYPQSQVALALYFAYVLTFALKSNNISYESHLTRSKQKYNINVFVVILMCTAIIFIAFASIQIYGVIPLDTHPGLRFWVNAKAIFIAYR